MLEKNVDFKPLHFSKGWQTVRSDGLPSENADTNAERWKLEIAFGDFSDINGEFMSCKVTVTSHIPEGRPLVPAGLWKDADLKGRHLKCAKA
jgi:hypothetical protein